MAAIDDFKKQLKAGKIIDAFQTALSEAAELEITTWVSSPESANPEESQPGDRLRTRINIIEGHIDNEVGAEFVGDGAYKELQQLHISQVQESHKIIQNNLNSLQKLFGLLIKVHRLNPDVTTVEIDGDITTITGTETGLHELVFVPPVTPPAGLLEQAKLPTEPEAEPWEPFVIPYPTIIIDGYSEEPELDEDLSYFADDATADSSTPTLVTDVGWEELVADETPLDTPETPTESEDNWVAFDVATPALELPETTEDSSAPSSEDSGDFNLAVPVAATLGTVAAIATLGTLAANQSSSEEALLTDETSEPLSASAEEDLGELDLETSTSESEFSPEDLENLPLEEPIVSEDVEALAIEGEAWGELGLEESTVAAVSSDPFAAAEEDWEEFTTEEVEPTVAEPLEISSVNTEENSSDSNIAATAAVVGLGTLAAAVTLGALASNKDEDSLTDTPIAESESLSASTDEEWGDIGLEDPLTSPVAEPESLLASTDEEWGDIGLEDPLPSPVAEPESLLASTDEEWGDIGLEDPLPSPVAEPESLLASTDEEWGDIGLEDPLPSPVAEPESLLASTDEEWGDIGLEDPLPSPVAEPESLLASTDEEWGDIGLEDPLTSPVAEPESLLASTDEEWGDIGLEDPLTSPVAEPESLLASTDEEWGDIGLEDPLPSPVAEPESLLASTDEEWGDIGLEDPLPSPVAEPESLLASTDEEWGDIGLEDPLPSPVAEPESLLASTDEEWGDIGLEDPLTSPVAEPESLLASTDEEWGDIGLEDPLTSPVAEPESLLASTDEEWGDIGLEDPLTSPVAEPESLLASTDEEWGDIGLEDPLTSPVAEPETLLSSTDEEWGDLSSYEPETSPLTPANDPTSAELIDEGWENLVLDETDPFTGAATTNVLSAEPAAYEEWQELVLEEELPSTQTDFDGLGGKADAALNFEEPDSYVDLMESLDANPFGDPLGGDAAELLELTSAESESSNLSFDEFSSDPLQDSLDDFSLESLTEEIPSLDDSDPFSDLILDDELGLPPLPPPPPPHRSPN